MSQDDGDASEDGNSSYGISDDTGKKKSGRGQKSGHLSGHLWPEPVELTF